MLPRFTVVWEADEVSDRETLLEMAQRHVREDEERLARQAAIVDKLERHNHREAAILGKQVLENMTITLDMAKRHLRAIEMGMKR